jgi:RNA polymerase sigma-70 factor (ECF subfamily)
MQRPLAPDMAELVDEHYRAVFGYAYRLSGSVIESEDLTQQTFMLAQSNLAQLRELRAARGWLYTIVRNEFLRRRPVLSSITLDDASEPSHPESESGWIDGDLTSEQLQAALNELPLEFRVPVVLFYFENLSYRDIASNLNLPLGTIMSRLSRAKSQLRKTLEKHLLESQTP